MSKLKQLQVRRSNLAEELKRLDEERREISSAYTATEKKLRLVDSQINTLKRDPVVSEHAILRYFERVLGYDIEAIKQSILCNKTQSAIKSMVSGKYNTENYSLVVKDMVVTTVITKDTTND